jgi:hypothetical protein
MPKISEELRTKIREAFTAEPSLSGKELGKRFGVHKATANDLVSDLRMSAGPYGFPVPAEEPVQKMDKPETSQIEGDDWTITLPKTRIHTLDELIAYCEVDLSVWEVDRFVANKWEVGAKDANGDIQVTPLYQVKAFLKRKKHIVDAKAEIEALKAEAKEFMRVPMPVVYTTQDSDNNLELLIPDLHLAKLAYGKETGHKDYDVDLAEAAFDRAIDNQIQYNSHFNISEITLGVGNDVLQADNIQGTTFGGTKVDVDSRYRRTYVVARKMYSRAIEKLRRVAPVRVKVVPGNHDTLSAFTLGDSLECKFENYPDVFVDNGPIMHKIVEWGKVFLILTHGHQGKQSDYGIWMATEYPEIFGRTLFREIHCGHHHKLSLDEKFGIRVRKFGALCEPDEWHSNNLFTGNLRIAEGLLWNKHRGLLNHAHYTEVD